jgi:carboxymethylenebutenolidase
MARMETIDKDGSAMRICIASPQHAGPHPLVILMCHIGGLDDFTEDRIDRLAQAGFLSVAPDIFHYHDWFDDSNARRASLRDIRIIADIESTILHARIHAHARPGTLGIVGHCMGGRTALLGAGSIADIGPLAMYYGGRTMLSWGDNQGPTPFARIANVHGPVLGLFGQDDVEPSPADVDLIEAEFAKHAIDYSFHRYDGAGHAFQNFLSAERFRPDAAQDSWERTLHFLDQALLPSRKSS